jgi:hypothetical protein
MRITARVHVGPRYVTAAEDVTSPNKTMDRILCVLAGVAVTGYEGPVIVRTFHNGLLEYLNIWHVANSEYKSDKRRTPDECRELARVNIINGNKTMADAYDTLAACIENKMARPKLQEA